MASIIDTPSLGSDELPDAFICDPCNKDSLTEIATGFCINCNHYLCKNCYDIHTRPIPSRHHVLLDGNNIPKENIAAKVYLSCSKHDDKPVEYICDEHDFVGCVVCVTLEHKQCKLSYIEDRASEPESLKDHEDVVNSLLSAAKGIETSGKEADDNVHKLHESHDTSVGAIKKVKKDLLKTFEVLENEMLAESKSSRDENVVKLQTVKQDCDTANADIAKRIAHLQMVKSSDEKRKMYLATRHEKKHLQKIQEQMVPSFMSGAQIQRQQFVRNKNVNVLLNSVHNIGRLASIVEDWKLVPENDLPISSPDDKGRCAIKSIAHMPTGKLIIIDRNNKCIKVMDLLTDKIIYRHGLPVNLQAVTVIDTYRIAVVLENDKETFIRFFFVGENHLFEDGGFQMKSVHMLSDMLYSKGLLFLVYRDKPVIEIRDCNGLVMGYIKFEFLNKILIHEVNISISPEENIIYLIDPESRAMFSFTRDGDATSTYLEDNIELMAVEKEMGIVFTCNRIRKSISMLTPDLKKVNETGRLWDSTKTLTCLSFSEMTQTLYLAIHGEKSLKRFKLSK